MADNPHDAFFKLVFSQPEHAAGELRSVLPAGLAGRIAWDTLALAPGSFVDEAFAQSHADLLFSAQLDGRETLLYCLFEHLSTVAPLAAFRLLRYEIRIWDQWLSEHPQAKKLPPIVAVVVHHSESGWTAATSFEALIDASEEALPLLLDFLPRYRFLLDDVRHATDDELRARAGTALGKIALWCFRDVRRPDVLVRDLVGWFDLLREVLNAPNGLAAIRSVLRYIAIAARPVDRDQFEETVRLFAATTEDEMQTLYDVYVEESLERGRREGLESGRREVLLRLLRKRFGDLPERATERIAKAGIVQLDTWADNVLTASTLDGVFEGS